MEFTLGFTAGIAVVFIFQKRLFTEKLPKIFLADAGTPYYLVLAVSLLLHTNQISALRVFGMGKSIFLIVVTTKFLLVGCVMDIICDFNFHFPIRCLRFVDIHFGILMIVNLEIGYSTPPVGINVCCESF